MGSFTPSEPDTTGGTHGQPVTRATTRVQSHTASPPEVPRTAPTRAGACAAPPAGLGTGADRAGAARDPGRRGRVAAEGCGETAGKNLWDHVPHRVWVPDGLRADPSTPLGQG